jgi:hypothetical protein
MVQLKCNQCNQSVTTYLSSTIRLNPIGYMVTLVTPFFEKKIILKKYEEKPMYKCFLLTTYGNIC